MGIFLSKLADALSRFGQVEARILMLGLDAAGKTTILYKLKLNETVSTIPTIGFNVETVTPMKGLTFTVWDVGGQERIRSLWRHYFNNAEGLIFVVDSNDPARFTEAREELNAILDSDEMRGVPVLVFANKQDLPQARSTSQIMESMGMSKLTGRRWHVQGTCASNGEGLYEGLNTFSDMVKEFKSSRKY